MAASSPNRCRVAFLLVTLWPIEFPSGKICTTLCLRMSKEENERLGRGDAKQEEERRDEKSKLKEPQIRAEENDT